MSREAERKWLGISDPNTWVAKPRMNSGLLSVWFILCSMVYPPRRKALLQQRGTTNGPFLPQDLFKWMGYFLPLWPLRMPHRLTCLFESFLCIKMRVQQNGDFLLLLLFYGICLNSQCKGLKASFVNAKKKKKKAKAMKVLRIILPASNVWSHT